MKNLKEEEIIELFTKNNKNFHFDDCEILPIKENHDSIVTCDSMVEDTHFKISWHKPEYLAKKLFQINLSDIVASGGKPLWCLLQIGFSYEKISSEYLIKFIKQFLKECNKYQCSLIGGDTFFSKQMVLSLTMGGFTNHYITRKSYPDTLIYVTGNVGLSLLGFKILSNQVQIPNNLKSIALKRHLAPEARVQWAQKIYPYAISMMDVSDGLFQDLKKMARISQYQFEIYLEKVPIHPKFKKYISPQDAFISGEEYELIFTTNKKINFSFATQIGKVMNHKINKNTSPIKLLYYGKEYFLKEFGFEHF